MTQSVHIQISKLVQTTKQLVQRWMALLAPPAQESRFELVGRLGAARQPCRRHVSGSLELVSIECRFIG